MVAAGREAGLARGTASRCPDCADSCRTASTALPASREPIRLCASIVGLLAAAGVLAGCGGTGRGASTSGIPRELLLEARPVGRGPHFHPSAAGPVIGRCRRELGRRSGVHVEVFAANRVVIVPAGIGTLPPRSVSAGRISAARCYGDIVTLDPTGLLLVRPRGRLSVSEFFQSWGQPLSASRLTSFSAAPGSQVLVFVDGRRWAGNPGSVPLAKHAEIVLEVGPRVPPHRSYSFPPGT